MSQQFARVGGLRVRYATRGQGSPLLLLPGWGASHSVFYPLFGALSTDHELIIPDLPGFGLSEQPPGVWGSFEYADLIASFITQLGLQRPDVIGHSFGGKVAAALADRRPELLDKLVIVASPLIRLPPSLALRARMAAFKAVKRFSAVLPTAARPRFLAALASSAGSEEYRMAGNMRDILVKVVNEDLHSSLARIKAQVLLVWGENDSDVPPRIAVLAQEEIPHARLLVMEDSGHFCFLDSPSEFIASVTRFLDD